MAVYNHTPLATGAALTAAVLNAPLAQLDAAIRKNEYAKTAAPGVGDDINDGYAVGSTWVDVTADRVYIAMDVTAGAAVWKEVSFPASVTQNFTITGQLTVTVGGVPGILVDSAGRNVIGHTSGMNSAGINTKLQIYSATTPASVGGITVGQFSNDTRAPTLMLSKSRAGSIALGTIVQANDPLGEVIFAGDDGVNFFPAAAVRGYSDGTPGLGDMPGRLELQVSADGSTSPVVGLTIKNTRSVILNNGAIGTTATDGFLYLAACAGIPTGVPTAVTGRVPVVIDSTNNKMYIYSGGSWVALN